MDGGGRRRRRRARNSRNGSSCVRRTADGIGRERSQSLGLFVGLRRFLVQGERGQGVTAMRPVGLASCLLCARPQAGGHAVCAPCGMHTCLVGQCAAARWEPPVRSWARGRARVGSGSVGRPRLTSSCLGTPPVRAAAGKRARCAAQHSAGRLRSPRTGRAWAAAPGRRTDTWRGTGGSIRRRRRLGPCGQSGGWVAGLAGLRARATGQSATA
mmetsp:Transcript_18397/g.53712  ORF Transcript_18397/g.53712 Transcript_18397/m.53712 type:complete len:213 (+) Transcript_18397:191-829(+)